MRTPVKNNKKLLHLDLNHTSNWMSDGELLRRHSLYPEVTVCADDYKGVKLFHPSGMELILIELCRNEVDEIYATLAVDEDVFEEHARLISSMFSIYDIE